MPDNIIVQEETNFFQEMVDEFNETYQTLVYAEVEDSLSIIENRNYPEKG